ncbi:UNVERIFIED_CONTAM: hypothetical protein GTU68_041781, partial [Idotea baltica]|nr:hypothetical protein [Idotea baltica]
ALFPGSFDPFTNGHVDIVNRSLTLFDEITVAVLDNPGKKQLFSVEQRIELIQELFKDNKRVVVDSFQGLLVDYAKKNNNPIVIRGLRAISDFDYEAQMALMNKNLYEEIETCFLVAREENSYISSTLVKQIAPFGGDVSKIVPEIVKKALEKKFKL